MSFDITSANATLFLTVEELYPNGVQLYQFATDQSYSSEAEQIAETRMGVDGMMVAGYTPNIKVVGVNLEVSSPSVAVMDYIIQATKANRKPYKCMLVANVPSIGKTFTWSTGTLQTGSLSGGAAKVLNPMQYTFHFQDSEVSDTGVTSM